jgi:hypothetical protein
VPWLLSGAKAIEGIGNELNNLLQEKSGGTTFVPWLFSIFKSSLVSFNSVKNAPTLHRRELGCTHGCVLEV